MAYKTLQDLAPGDLSLIPLPFVLALMSFTLTTQASIWPQPLNVSGTASPLGLLLEISAACSLHLQYLHLTPDLTQASAQGSSSQGSSLTTISYTATLTSMRVTSSHLLTLDCVIICFLPFSSLEHRLRECRDFVSSTTVSSESRTVPGIQQVLNKYLLSE